MAKNATVTTLKSIAIAAGVTPAVVSAVLGGKNSSIRFSEATAERVQAAARRLKYRPHRMAQTLRTREHDAIALIATNIYHLPHLFLHWLSLELGRRDQLLIIQNLPGDTDPAKLPIFRQRVVDAGLCCEMPSARVMECIAETGLRTLFVNSDPPGRGPRVLFDERDAMKQAVQRLVASGARRIVLHHDEPGTDYWTRERRLGVNKAAADADLPRPKILAYRQEADARQRMAASLDDLVGAAEAGTGLILQDSSLLPLLLPRLAARGLRVPEDVAIVALGRPIGLERDPTWLELNTRELAAIVAERLLDPALSANGELIRVPYILRAGWTTRDSRR